MSRWINSNQFELIHLNENLKTKKNCFKNFNEVKVILKKNLLVMYVRDFRASILACKDYKINTKTWKKFFSSHVILQCIQSCNKVIFSQQLCSSILYTNVLYKNLFISRQLNKKISVIKLCLVRRKQKNPSWNNFTRKTCVKKNWSPI